MAKQKPIPAASVEGLLKAMLVFARTVEHALEHCAVTDAVQESLSASKLQILRLLAQRGGQTSSQVARYLNVSKPAVTQIIDAMVQSKWVTRKTATQDRRQVRLYLSAKGREYNQKVRRRQRHYVRTSLQGKRPVDAARWVETLQAMSSGLVRADRAFEDFCAQCGAFEDGTCVLVGGDALCTYLRDSGARDGNTRPKKRRVARG